jgi:excinuclease ABC subunit C
MNQLAKLQAFEKAKEIRNTIHALNHIQDVSLIKSQNNEINNGLRIEAYDIAHMSGKNTVGVMTVVINGEIKKSEYKKFKISKDANDDVAGLREILSRRLIHTEWKMPNLIVIDGGLGQLNASKKILENLNINVPIISVVKDDSHNPDHFLGDKNIIRENIKSILLANSEAHRFAINYHKKLRNKAFLTK